MEAHTHNFGTITGKPINRITNQNYPGSPGDKTILSYKCSVEGCDVERAFDYGSTEHMRVRYAELMGKKRDNRKNM